MGVRYDCSRARVPKRNNIFLEGVEAGHAHHCMTLKVITLSNISMPSIAFVDSTSLIRATLSFSTNEPASASITSAGLLHLRPYFALPVVTFSFIARFNRASLRSLKLITFAVPRITYLVN